MRVCPRPECGVKLSGFQSLLVHFQNRHPKVKLMMSGGRVVQCLKCDLHIIGNQVKCKHYESVSCREGTKKKARRRIEQKNKEDMEKRIRIENTELTQVPNFKYLGRMITQDKDDREAIDVNIQKARKNGNSLKLW